MSTAAVSYLRSYTFKPHIHGNSLLYGLNSFGVDSTIHCNGCLWRFVDFEGSDKARYINVEGKYMIIPLKYDEQITRMQICPPDKLDLVLEKYLIALDSYNKNLRTSESPKPISTTEIEALIEKTGYSTCELLSVLEFPVDSGYYFNLNRL